MAKFNLGDIVYHKVTNKKCVISSMSDNRIWVTTEDDLKTNYYEHEVLSEKEWEDKNVNSFA